jgi:hypothetical protein
MSNLQDNTSNPELDDISPPAQRETGLISLKCRTLEEASLICEELEKGDIIASLPGERELESQFQQKGYVEIKVSATAYAQLADLRSSVEFNYQQTAAEIKLSVHGIIANVVCGLLIPFGALVFLKLFFSNKNGGYVRKAREIANWFTVGAVLWVIGVLALCIALSPSDSRWP